MVTRERVAICGASGTGKTTLALSTYPRHRVLHTDDWIAAGNEPAARYVAEQLNNPDYDCYEGVLMPLVLVRWLDRNPHSMPVARVIVLTVPQRRQTPAQVSQGRYYTRVLDSMRARLERRGVVLEVRL